MQKLIPFAALNLALSVAIGAFGAHALKNQLTPDRLETFHTASQYHQIHGVGLLVVIALALNAPAPSRLRATTALLGVGMIVFCGVLYALSLGGPRWLGAVAPVGGASIIAGWASLAFVPWRTADEK